MKKAIYLGAFFVMFAGKVFGADPIVTDSTSNSTVNSNAKTETTLKSPPPSAISPSINATNSDVCTIAFSGAVQTQVLGISGGGTVRDLNCERLKLSKTLYDMGMKVAAVSVMCQDDRVFDAMIMAGTPCPIDGKIGEDAKKLWTDNPDKAPKNSSSLKTEEDSGVYKNIGFGALGLGLLWLLL